MLSRAGCDPYDFDVGPGVTIGGEDQIPHDTGFQTGFDVTAPAAWGPDVGMALTMDVRYRFPRDTAPSRPELDGCLITIGLEIVRTERVGNQQSRVSKSLTDTTADAAKKTIAPAATAPATTAPHRSTHALARAMRSGFRARSASIASAPPAR